MRFARKRTQCNKIIGTFSWKWREEEKKRREVESAEESGRCRPLRGGTWSCKLKMHEFISTQKTFCWLFSPLPCQLFPASSSLPALLPTLLPTPLPTLLPTPLPTLLASSCWLTWPQWSLLSKLGFTASGYYRVGPTQYNQIHSKLQNELQPANGHCQTVVPRQ